MSKIRVRLGAPQQPEPGAQQQSVCIRIDATTPPRVAFAEPAIAGRIDVAHDVRLTRFASWLVRMTLLGVFA
jgi:hypothetical protein